MNFTKAFAVFMQIDSKEFTEDEKYEAIQQVLDAATINSITKKQVLNVVSWLFNKQQKYRWHGMDGLGKHIHILHNLHIFLYLHEESSIRPYTAPSLLLVWDSVRSRLRNWFHLYKQCNFPR